MFFRFANIEILWALLSIPVLIGAHLWMTQRKRKQRELLGDSALIEALMPNASHIRPHVKFGLEMVALLLLIFALARPQRSNGKEKEVVNKREGIEVMVALDISNSMLAEDVAPNRLDRAKQMVSKMVDQMANDKVGLVVFAGESYTQLPITCDYVSAKMFLQSANPDLISAQGTAIGEAIRTCVTSFGEADKEISRAIIIITDGENHEDDAVQAAKNAVEKGIHTYVVGIGKPEGSPLPDGRGGFKKDKSGNVVISRLNEAMCQEIAQAGNGFYVRADNSNTANRALFKELDKLGKAEIESVEYTEWREEYQLFVFFALLILAAEFFIFNRKNKFFSKLNIFGDKK